MKNEPIILTPTDTQIINCASFGWDYIGEGFFERDNMFGFFTTNQYGQTTFHKEGS